jgi:putative peptidoglycan lipid II flippase
LKSTEIADPRTAEPPAAPASVFRSASIVSAAVALSRVSGLVREMVMARLFGASLAYDAFLLAFRIPNLTRDLFAEGALSSAFVPKFTEYLNHRSREEAAQLANLVATALIMLVGGFCLLGMAASPWLVGLLAPGFHQVPGKFELAVSLTRVMFPFLLLVALAAQAMGILNACGQFGIPAISSTFFNLGSVVFGLILGLVLGPQWGLQPIEGMAWGVVGGGALQMLVQIPALAKQGFRFRFLIDWQDPGLRHILALMGPAILGSAAVQINVMVNTSFAADVLDPLRGHDGPVSWLGYAFRFMQLPLGLFGVAIASATLPAVSRSAAAGNTEEFRRTLSRSVGMVFLLTVPSSAGLIILGRSMIGAIYEGGSFNAYDTAQTALALNGFAFGLVGYAAMKVLTPAFYALQDSRTPMVISLLSVGVNFFTATTLIRLVGLGHEGLAMTTSAVAVFGFLTLFWILRGRLGGINGRELASSFARIVVAAMAMGLVVYFVNDRILALLGPGKLSYLAALAAAIPGGAAVYWAVCRMLDVPELEPVTRSLDRFNPWRRATISTR